MERFPNPLDLSRVSIWVKTHTKHLEGRFIGGKEKKLEGDWINLLSIIFKADQSDFVFIVLDSYCIPPLICLFYLVYCLFNVVLFCPDEDSLIDMGSGSNKGFLTLIRVAQMFS